MSMKIKFIKEISLKWLGEKPDIGKGVTFGMPWARGELDRSLMDRFVLLEKKSIDALSIDSPQSDQQMDDDGNSKLLDEARSKSSDSINSLSVSDTDQVFPVQSWATAYWPDGSVKWTAHSISFAAVYNNNKDNNKVLQNENTKLEYSCKQVLPDQFVLALIQAQSPEESVSHKDITNKIKSQFIINCIDSDELIIIDCGYISWEIPKQGSNLVDSVYINYGKDKIQHVDDESSINNVLESNTISSVQNKKKKQIACSGRLVSIKEERQEQGESNVIVEQFYESQVESAMLEQAGPYRAVVKITGKHHIIKPIEILSMDRKKDKQQAIDHFYQRHINYKMNHHDFDDKNIGARHQDAEINKDGTICEINEKIYRDRFSRDIKADDPSWLPFTVRFIFYAGSNAVQMKHSFVYDGQPETDFIKGLGIRFDLPQSGPAYNRHVWMSDDHDYFHEACQHLSQRSDAFQSLYPVQVSGTLINNSSNYVEDTALVQDMAVWNQFKLVQDSADHFVLRKRTQADCGWVDIKHGFRSQGIFNVGSENGSMSVGLKDFWQKSPGAFELTDFSSETAHITMWLWSPDTPAMDLRHYDTKTHTVSSYEGAIEMKSTAYGIANTHDLLFHFSPNLIDRTVLESIKQEKQNPPLLIADAKHYHQKKAFGVWSLADRSTKTKDFIEDQLDFAIEFYKNEIEQRGWYGFWHYGDFMHSYDAWRHCWKYDIGGYAWQNTELVPNMWLWLSFIRTGREDIFRLAEAMTRHTSEVDMYHIGPYKGLGSRHNVLHWGCSSKEGRMAMAGLHRYHYYLTVDDRLGDIFEETKDADFSTLNIDPMREYQSGDGHLTHARSGPDWASYVSNWMTRWERFEDTRYRDKILTGIESLKKMPHRLLSGSSFGYNPYTSELHYIGEATYGYHLAICMGEPQVWFELVDMIDDQCWQQMLNEFGRFYYLSQEEKIELTSPDISKDWNWPMFAAGIAAYAAYNEKNDDLARQVWDILLKKQQFRGIRLPMRNSLKSISQIYTDDNLSEMNPEMKSYHQKPLQEISWISTNGTAQWCLNLIVCLELIGEYLPEKNEIELADE